MSSKKGKELVVVNGFKFCAARTLKNNTTVWRCVNKKSKCSAQVITPSVDVAILLETRLNHNHEADPTIQRQLLNNGVKTKAVKDVYKKPGQLIQQELRSIPSLSEDLTTRDLELIR